MYPQNLLMRQLGPFNHEDESHRLRCLVEESPWLNSNWLINRYNIVDDNEKEIDWIFGEERKEWNINELDKLI